jgi:hypothetical protein
MLVRRFRPTGGLLRLVAGGLALVVAIGLLFVDRAQATNSGAAVLAPGEAKSVRINGVYRDIRVCNDVESLGTIVVVISRHAPVRLAPGFCIWGGGDRVSLRNESGGTAAAIYQVTGVHQS